MSYKYSKGAQVIGDLKAADDAERNTLIDFGEDQIDLQTSGTIRVNVSNTGVYIPDPGSDFALTVSGNVVIGDGGDLTFQKGTSDIAFIKFREGSEGTSYNGYLGYSAAEQIYISPGRGGHFYVQTRTTNAGDPENFPFRIYDTGKVKFEINQDSVANSNSDMPADVVFSVSGTVGGKNLGEGVATFTGDLVVSGTLHQDSGQRVNTTVVSSFPYTVLDDDYVILVGGTGTPRRINLPAKANHQGRVLIIKDSVGNASSNNIELNPNESETIDGYEDRAFNSNRVSVTVVCADDGWHIISQYSG